MKFSNSFIFIFAISTVYAQVPKVPNCAMACLNQLQQDAASTGCGPINAANRGCFCAHKGNFRNSINCARQHCNNDDANKAISAIMSFC